MLDAKAFNLHEALRLLEQPNHTSSCSARVSEYGRLLRASTRAKDVSAGRRLHKHIIQSKLEQHIRLRIGLFEMYLECDCLEEARCMFDKIRTKFTSVPLWTSMISAYSAHHLHHRALQLFYDMLLEGVRPSSVTFMSVVTACSACSNLTAGRRIHQHISETGLENTDLVLATALVQMYGKCGCLEEACRVFAMIKHRDMIAWTAMISVYAQYSRCEEALKLCRYMQLEGESLDEVTCMAVLPACADESALPYGVAIHTVVRQAGFESDVRVGNALIHMYGNCGSLSNALKVFEKMKARNVISWTAIIAAHAQLGLTIESLDLFRRMQQQGVEPDSVSFTSILTACSHAGLTSQGLEFFSCMTQDYGISPLYEHYGCLLDLLSRAGWLNTAQEFLSSIPARFQSDAKLWRAFISACKTYGDNRRGRHAAGKLVDMHPRDSSGYVVFSNLYRRKSPEVLFGAKPFGTVSSSFATLAGDCSLSTANVAASVVGGDFTQHVVPEDEEPGSFAPRTFLSPARLT